MTDLDGQIVGERYRILSTIASGGMATVYLAEDSRLERRVALKLVHPHLAAEPNFRAKFLQEAKIAARLSHPNLVNVFDQGEWNDRPFLVMEYVPGITLRDALSRFGALDASRSLDAIEPTLQGLAAAHQAGILHRDIKPENILLADNGSVKLSDFGLARSVNNQTSADSLVGTAAYLSPELIERGYIDERSDIYAIGIVLYELLTGKQPFKGDQAIQIAMAHTSQKTPLPSDSIPSIPRDLDELVGWMTEKNPALRPANADAVLAIIKKLRAGIAVAQQRRDAGQMASSGIQQTTPLTFSAANQTELIDGIEPQATAAATEVLGTAQTVGSAQTEIFNFSDSPVEASSRPNHKRPKSPLFKVIIAAALTVLLGMGVGWWFGAGPNGFKAVPDLANRTVDEAQAALVELNPNIKISEESDSETAAGYIIRTEPAAGSWFFGGDLVLVVSTGPEMLAAPKLVGKTLPEAQAAILAQGFKLGSVNSFFDQAPIGTVFEHTGSDGTTLAEGSAIDLKVSLGKIPLVVELTEDQAKIALSAVGISVAEVITEFSDKVAAGKVISLVPLTEPLGESGSVNLIVSKGPNLVAMPNLVGETLLAAKTALEQLGLTVTVNTDQLQSRWGIAKVKTTSPAAGTMVKVGSGVTISSR